MKRIISLLLVLTLAVFTFSACGSKGDDGLIVINIGASPTPHAEILKIAKEVLEEEGKYTLNIMEFQDYVLPNTSLEENSLDANYFQHQMYLDDFNEKNSTHIVSVADIHYEPYGIYPGRKSQLSELEEGDQIAVPNDTTNEARALLLLEQEGIIKLSEGVGLMATKNDITENPYGIEVVELAAAQLTRSLPDVDFAVINGNYAIGAGLNVSQDAVATESQDSDVIQSYYVNVLCVKEGNEDTEMTKALIAALTSEKVRQYIDDTYKGAVVPLF